MCVIILFRLIFRIRNFVTFFPHTFANYDLIFIPFRIEHKVNTHIETCFSKFTQPVATKSTTTLNTHTRRCYVNCVRNVIAAYYMIDCVFACGSAVFEVAQICVISFGRSDVINII